MIYIYDGSFDGLLTVIFQKYKDIGRCEIRVDDGQVNFLDTEIIKTDLSKAQRVIDGIQNNIGDDFMGDIYKVFKSNHPRKEEIIAIATKSCMVYGNVYLGSSKMAAVEFRSILKNFGHEVHTYKGLLRFREIQDNYLLAEIEAENDVLEHVTYHFIKRMPAEKFIIYDKNRKKASLCIYGDYEEVEILGMDAIETEDENIFRDAWVGFYDAIGISERKNQKLMVSNMPKKYWKYLPERNR